MSLENVYVSKKQVREEKIERFYQIIIYDELKRKKYQSWFTSDIERAIEIADILGEDIDKYQEVHIFLEEFDFNNNKLYCSDQNVYRLVYKR